MLARWLLRQCRVLLLDEPTRGVDVGAKAEIYRVIADLAARRASASSSCPPSSQELLGLCTRVLVMREGELVAEVDGDEATELELLRHAVAPTDTEPVIAWRRSDEHHRRRARRAAGRCRCRADGRIAAAGVRAGRASSPCC